MESVSVWVLSAAQMFGPPTLVVKKNTSPSLDWNDDVSGPFIYSKTGFGTSHPMGEWFWVDGTIFFPGFLLPPEFTNMAGWKTQHLSRYMSYLNMGIFQAMLIFRLLVITFWRGCKVGVVLVSIMAMKFHDHVGISFFKSLVLPSSSQIQGIGSLNAY